MTEAVLVVATVALTAIAAPTAAATARNYTVVGAIEVDTNENTLFWFDGAMYVLENIPCYYSEHAGQWDPKFLNASYSRIRRWDTGAIVVNISETIGFGFVSAFADDGYEGGPATPTLWLFGSACNRCPHKDPGPQGCIAGRHVQAWSSTNLGEFATTTISELPATYNVEVSRVHPPQNLAGITAAYVMILEPFVFAAHTADPDLTHGWVTVKSKSPKLPVGGPSIRFNPTDLKHYIITGGTHVFLGRTKDFVNWEYSPYAPFIEPSPEDADIAPYAGFPAVEAARQFGPMHADYTKWDWNSNDADVCCLTPGAPANISYVIWGAGTQGRTPKPPLTKANHCVNAVGVANMSLSYLLMAHFGDPVFL